MEAELCYKCASPGVRYPYDSVSTIVCCDIHRVIHLTKWYNGPILCGKDAEEVRYPDGNYPTWPVEMKNSLRQENICEDCKELVDID